MVSKMLIIKGPFNLYLYLLLLFIEPLNLKNLGNPFAVEILAGPQEHQIPDDPLSVISVTSGFHLRVICLKGSISFDASFSGLLNILDMQALRV